MSTSIVDNKNKKHYYNETYKILYDTFLRYISQPLFPIDNFRAEDFITDKSKSIMHSLNKCDIHRSLKFFEEMKARMRYVGSGSTGHFFKGIILKNSNKPVNDPNNLVCYFAMKLTPYQKVDAYSNIYDISRPENTELNMLKCLSYFVLSGQTRHLLLPVQSFYTPMHEFVKMMNANKLVDKKQRYKQFIDDYMNDRFEDTASVMISEYANAGDFLNYIREHKGNITPLEWKIFFFQILSTLAVIHEKYPSFRHNDLKANNILMQEIVPQKFVYRFRHNGEQFKFILPQFKYVLKLWDFDFACIEGVVDNIKVKQKWTMDINISSRRNQYYDIHFFFYTLQMFYKDILNPKVVGQETVDFINDVIPEKYKAHPKSTVPQKANTNGRLLVDDEYTTAIKLISTHKYFNEFRIK